MLTFSMVIKPSPENTAGDQTPDIAGGDYLASGKASHSRIIMAMIRIRWQWTCSEGVGKGGESGLRVAAADESFQ